MRISDWSADVCSSDLQVDVRMREQLAATVAADGEQGQPRVAGNAARPGVADQGVDGARTVCDEALDRFAAVEAHRQRGIGTGKRVARSLQPGRLVVRA